MLEHLQQRATPTWQMFLPQLLQGIKHNEATIRQPACYGASLAAKDPQFAPMAMETAAALSQLVDESRKRAKKKSDQAVQACADNALSALVHILTSHQPSL